ncbi:MAG: hypothetical protein HYU76_06955 [Betaproteobacteria bacterium]|nr:hypothetical protein [Betaproteobacteria bacterium]
MLERIVIGFIVLALAVLAFFFLAAALAAGAILASVVLLRFWWLKRKLRKAAEEEFIAAEYTVVEREKLSEPPMDPVRGPASNGVNADERE